MLTEFIGWIKGNPILAGITGFFILTFLILLFVRVRISFSKKGPLKFRRLIVFGFISFILFFGVPVSVFLLIKFYLLPPEETLKSVLTANLGAFIIAIIGWTITWLILFFKLFDKLVLKAEPLITDEAKKTIFEFKVPVPSVKLENRFKLGNILLASTINEQINYYPYLALYIKLNGLAPCDFLWRPEDFKKPRYRVAIVLGTDGYWTKSPRYNTEDARDIIHPYIIEFLKRGNYLIAAHDCHFWGKVGHFGPPATAVLNIRPSKKHAITRGIECVSLLNEEGSFTRDPIRPYSNPGVKDEKPLFRAEMVAVSIPNGEEQPEFEKEFDAAWLMKYHSSRYNLFYWAPAHAQYVLRDEDFINVIYNAAKYFLKRY